MLKATDHLPWPHDALDATIGKLFQKAVYDNYVDQDAIRRLARFVREHRDICKKYGTPKLSGSVLTPG